MWQSHNNASIKPKRFPDTIFLCALAKNSTARCISIRSDVNFDKRTHIIIVIISHINAPWAPRVVISGVAAEGEIPWSILSGSWPRGATDIWHIDIRQRKMKFLGASTHQLLARNKIRIMLKLCKAQQFTKWSTPALRWPPGSPLHGEWQRSRKTRAAKPGNVGGRMGILIIIMIILF